MARSLNKVMLIGNLTRDPEMRYTPNGAAVCTFGIATNRDWKTETGEKKEDVEFHNVVAWSKLAEICSQLLKKGRKVYVEGRLSTRTWQATDGAQKNRTEVVINDMVILDKKEEGSSTDFEIPETQVESVIEDKPTRTDKSDKKASASAVKTLRDKATTDKEEVKVEEPEDEDIPF